MFNMLSLSLSLSLSVRVFNTNVTTLLGHTNRVTTGHNITDTYQIKAHWAYYHQIIDIIADHVFCHPNALIKPCPSLMLVQSITTNTY